MTTSTVLSYSAPRLLVSSDSHDANDAEWVIGLAALAVIAAYFGITVTAVVNICNWCHTTSSFQVCMDGVRRWFSSGC